LHGVICYIANRILWVVHPCVYLVAGWVFLQTRVVGNMKKTLSILILIQILSCSDLSKERDSESAVKEIESFKNQNRSSEKVKEVSQQEELFNQLLDSIKIYKIQPIDSLLNEYWITQTKNVKIGKNQIQIFKKDSFNIDWIKINSNKFSIKTLKIVNNPTDGDNDEMFCNSLKKAKLYKFNSHEIIILEFISSPGTGIGSSVTDYLIYDKATNQLTLFESFRRSDFDFYQFPFNKKLNYISTDYKGDYHGATPIHFISKIYSLNSNGKFQLEKDSKGKEYYYEIVTYPNDQKRGFEYKWNWF